MEKTLESKISVYRQFTEDGVIIKESIDENVIMVHRFPEGVTPATVQRVFSSTVSTAPYENMKITISITVPCYTEEISSAINFAKNQSLPILDEEVKKLKGL